MKKGIIIAVVAVIAVAAIVCGVIFLGGNNAPKVEVADSADVLNKVFTTYAEEDKFFAMGGDFSNPVDGAAGIYSLEDKEGMAATLHISEDLIGQIDEAASYLHAMNANTFTGAAFHLADAKSAESFSASLKESVLSTQWMCGFPEKIVMYTINGGEYVVYAVGAADLVDNFSATLMMVYGESAVETVNEALEA
ncbi:MAG: hypothetical protein IIX14_03985 [Clostridia bacterium]|nr:hypothetical protein [Clostridia bacterium]